MVSLSWLSLALWYFQKFNSLGDGYQAGVEDQRNPNSIFLCIILCKYVLRTFVSCSQFSKVLLFCRPVPTLFSIYNDLSYTLNIEDSSIEDETTYRRFILRGDLAWSEYDWRRIYLQKLHLSSERGIFQRQFSMSIRPQRSGNRRRIFALRLLRSCLLNIRRNEIYRLRRIIASRIQLFELQRKTR